MEKIPNKNIDLDKYLIDIVTAGLEGDFARLEVIALTLSRVLKKEKPVISNKIEELITKYSLAGPRRIPLRGVNIPSPVDNDTQLEMATIIPPSDKELFFPILNEFTKERIDNFINERKNIAALLNKNLIPSSKILLIGHPGTGKTMLAKYLATLLNKNLVVLDLSSTISSLMGKTGHNIKKVLQYVKQTHSVLLLDEFDAIAKKRDDNTDLGEIKRVVNVLLMELEEWPVSSIVIATSNHPELLDRAFWRRFDQTIEIPLPKQEQIFSILNKELNDFLEKETKLTSLLNPISKFLEGWSASDVCKYANNVKRRIILKKEKPEEAGIRELELFVENKKKRNEFTVLAKKVLNVTVRELSEMTDLSPSGVQYILKNSKS